jgi:pilus assembly protein Flp/PilA
LLPFSLLEADNNKTGMTGFVMIRRFLKDERGTTAIEYGLIASLIVVAVIGGITAVGQASVLALNNIADQL